MSAPLSPSELVAIVAQRAEMPRAEVRRLLTALAGVVAEQLLAGHRAKLPDIGALAPSWRPERTGTAPNGKTWVKPGGYRVAFKPWPNLKVALAAAPAPVASADTADE